MSIVNKFRKFLNKKLKSNHNTSNSEFDIKFKEEYRKVFPFKSIKPPLDYPTNLYYNSYFTYNDDMSFYNNVLTMNSKAYYFYDKEFKDIYQVYNGLDVYAYVVNYLLKYESGIHLSKISTILLLMQIEFYLTHKRKLYFNTLVNNPFRIMLDLSNHNTGLYTVSTEVSSHINNYRAIMYKIYEPDKDYYNPKYCTLIPLVDEHLKYEERIGYNKSIIIEYNSGVFETEVINFLNHILEKTKDLDSMQCRQYLVTLDLMRDLKTNQIITDNRIRKYVSDLKQQGKKTILKED